MPASEQGRRIGHEFLGVAEDLGADVSGLKRGDVVVAPFMWADNTCDSCSQGLHTSCRHGGQWGVHGVDGGQGEAVRVPQARGTLVRLPVREDSALLLSLLTLSDVFCTGHHCAVTAGVGSRTTVTVIGDGAVGLSAVLAAKRLGAERILLMGRHADRTDLGREFGATDVIPERGDEGIARVRELTGGDGTHTVLECVGLKPALETAFAAVRDGGVVGRVGARQYADVPANFGVFMRNITLTGGVAPARAYIEELLPDVLDGTIEPGKVFDRTIGLEDVPNGYRAMADREALKVLVQPLSDLPDTSRPDQPTHFPQGVAMVAWTSDELTRIGTAEELRITLMRRDGTPRNPVTVWVARLGNGLYVRSVNGPSAAWFRGTQARREGHIRAGSIDKDVTFVLVDAGDQINDQIDAAYRAKYRRSAASIIGHIVSAKARSATIKIAPRPTSY